MEHLTGVNLTSNSVSEAVSYVEADDSAADVVTFLTDDIWGESGVAKSFLKKVCRSPPKTSRLNICEHSRSPTSMADVNQFA